MTFEPGQSTQTVSVPLLNDDVYELSEEFTGRLSLEAGSSGITISQDSAVATIADDDGECSLVVDYYTPTLLYLPFIILFIYLFIYLCHLWPFF